MIGPSRSALVAALAIASFSLTLAADAEDAFEIMTGRPGGSPNHFRRWL